MIIRLVCITGISTTLQFYFCIVLLIQWGFLGLLE